MGAGKRKGKQRAAPAAKESHASAALKELRRQTRETVRGLESAAAAPPPPPRGGLGFENEGMEDLLKQFEELAGSQVWTQFSYNFLSEKNYILFGLSGVFG